MFISCNQTTEAKNLNKQVFVATGKKLQILKNFLAFTSVFTTNITRENENAVYYPTSGWPAVIAV